MPFILAATIAMAAQNGIFRVARIEQKKRSGLLKGRIVFFALKILDSHTSFTGCVNAAALRSTNSRIPIGCWPVSLKTSSVIRS